jgi:4-amino-4-deoxychorismate lyase
MSAEDARVDGIATDRVSVLERGLHYGDGLFETIACPHGVPRFLELHLARLREGCERLRIETPAAAALAREVHALLTPGVRAVVKLLVTRGVAQQRGYAASAGARPSRIALRYAWPVPAAAAAREGVRVRLAALRLGENPLLAGLKHLNRLEQVLAREEWHDPDIAEALLFSSSGRLISGTMSNVFLVRDGRLVTPRMDLCGVAGIMRRVVLQEAPACGIIASEEVLRLEDLQGAQEVFLTNALTGIRPVRDLAGMMRSPGPLTQRLQGQLAPILHD